MNVPFNRPYLTGRETRYIEEAVKSGKLSGNGDYTRRCHEFFERAYGFPKCLLTSSCTDALEMAAILCDVVPGDEVIVPSYTFVSTANAFVLRGATLVFADSSPVRPGLDESKLEALITDRTKVIVVVHYAGVACDMDLVMRVASKHNLWVVEDAAQAIDSRYKGKPLGSIGHLAAFSFHETKNIIAGEGGMLVVNEPRFRKRAEVVWEKGTNRSAFWRGEVDKYGWIDIGSSFLPSEITAAFLFAQLEHMDTIQSRRIARWNQYDVALRKTLSKHGVGLPQLPDWATNNAHLFYLICRSGEERTALIKFLKDAGIYAAFHYLSLHNSPFYHDKFKGDLPWSDFYADRLVRLPLFFELESSEVEYVVKHLIDFYEHAG